MLLLGRITAMARCGLLLQTKYRGLSVCLSVDHVHEPCKNGWTDQDSRRGMTHVGPRNHCVIWGRGLSTGRGNFGGCHLVRPGEKHSGVSVAVYVGNGIIQSSITAYSRRDHSIRNNNTTCDAAFYQNLWPVVIFSCSTENKICEILISLSLSSPVATNTNTNTNL